MSDIKETKLTSDLIEEFKKQHSALRDKSDEFISKQFGLFPIAEELVLNRGMSIVDAVSQAPQYYI